MPQKLIIIGATSGIGREIAMLYARQDHRIGITGRRANLLNELKEKYPQQIFTSCFDVMKNENRQRIQELIYQLGGLDLLIYNAGYGNPSGELNFEVENTTIQTNVNGFVEIAGYTFNYFMQQGHGQIAIMSSVAAMRGNSRAPAYSASKAFMSNYAEGLNIKAKRLKKDIVVTDIRPGFINTKKAKNKQFWVVSREKAARQIIHAIEKRKKIAYISKRWWLVAQIMKLLPYFVYRRIV